MPNHYVMQVFVYTAIIFGVMWWSGWKEQKTIYNIAAVRVEGDLFFVSDPQEASKFYEEVLALSPVGKATSRSATLELPDRSLLHLERFPASNTSGSAGANEAPAKGLLLVQVRNAFERLHADLVRRSRAKPFSNSDQRYTEQMEPRRVSEIVTYHWGSEFVVSDFDQNKVVYYKTVRGRSYRQQ